MVPTRHHNRNLKLFSVPATAKTNSDITFPPAKSYRNAIQDHVQSTRITMGPGSRGAQDETVILHAPRTEPPTPSQELARFMKIVGRLKWKLPFLAEGYRLATLPADRGVDVAHAEIMFKIDFFEYYALLERAIVHLLGVFGVTVTGAVTRSQSTPRLGRNRSRVAAHRYHANVLDTLEGETCPLHAVLGSGNVREQLRKAKELRNRWKTADMSKEEAETDPFRRPKETAMPLESYDFDHILSEIFIGLEDGLALARDHLARAENSTGNDLSGDSEADWDFIVDAMDWEAV